MVVSLAINRPKPGAEPGLTDAMHRFGAAAHGAPGLQRIHTLPSAEDGMLVGLAIWDTEDEFHSARITMRAAIADVDFNALGDVVPKAYPLVDV